MFLELHGVYTMIEVARIKLPRSLNELVAFLSQNNFHLLVYVYQVFWSNCDIALDQNTVTKHYHSTFENIYRLTDESRNKYHECLICFKV
jgi:hypothetical protein